MRNYNHALWDKSSYRALDRLKSVMDWPKKLSSPSQMESFLSYMHRVWICFLFQRHRDAASNNTSLCIDRIYYMVIAPRKIFQLNFHKWNLQTFTGLDWVGFCVWPSVVSSTPWTVKVVDRTYIMYILAIQQSDIMIASGRLPNNWELRVSRIRRKMAKVINSVWTRKIFSIQIEASSVARYHLLAFFHSSSRGTLKVHSVSVCWCRKSSSL